MQNGLCAYCSITVPPDGRTLDHIEPHSMGGPTDTHNAVMCCHECNQKKGTKDLYTFLLHERMTVRPMLEKVLKDRNPTLLEELRQYPVLWHRPAK